MTADQAAGPPHFHDYGPWRRVNARGAPPVSRDDDAWTALLRSCSCGAVEYRHKADAG